jgi:RimJ/RimL family protein N-acetyltransferase
MHLFASGQTYSPEELAASFAGVLKEYADTGLGNYAVIERATATIVGHCGVHVSAESGVHAELDWLISRDRWNRGYATEAGEAVLSSAFALHGFHTIGGVAHRDNAASIAVMRKLKMLPAAEIVRHGMPSVLYSVTAETFSRTS